MPTPTLERKAFAEYKLLTEGAGGFEGYASLFGVKDDGGDVVDAGAFAATLEQFVQKGFAPVGHEWSGLPVGYFTEAREDERGLFVRGVFHSTPEAQSARTVAQERLAAGKNVGLSIGYMVPAGGSYRGVDGARHLKAVDLYEVSLVNAPMLRPAGLTSVKAALPSAPGADVATAPPPRFDLGARVQVIGPPHMAGQGAGEVREAVLTYSYGIVFDGMEAMGIHRWYVEDELAAVGAEPMAPMAAGAAEPAARKSLPAGTYEGLIEALNEALNEALGGSFGPRWGWVLYTYPDRCIVVVCDEAGGDGDYYEIPYTLDAQGAPIIGEPLPVEQVFVPVNDRTMFANQLSRVLADLRGLAARSKLLAGLRAKEGRVLSETNRTRLAALADSMRTVLADVDDLLSSTERGAAGVVDAARMAELRQAHLRLQFAHLRGVS